MIKDDILRMAKEADLWLTSDERIAAVTRFAQLIAAHEREECAKVCERKNPLPSEYSEQAEFTIKRTVLDCATTIRERAKTT